MKQKLKNELQFKNNCVFNPSVFAQVSATRPSPVKAIFSQEELEVAALSLSQLLMTELLHPDSVSEPSSKVSPGTHQLSLHLRVVLK